MLDPGRRVLFNPTSLPCLRAARAQRNFFYNAPHTPRPNLGVKGGVRGVRRESTKGTSTGEDSTGHISAGKNEGILFFDNLFPLKLQWLLRLPLLSSDRSLPEILSRFQNGRFGFLEPMALVKRAIPSSIPIKVTEILPRLKDGGAFVKFSHPDGITAKEVEGLITGYLREHRIKPWFNPFSSVDTRLVKGRPWLEDLYRMPSSRLKIELMPTKPGEQAAELSQETIYSLFRRYGKIAEITPQPSDSKVMPRYAFLDFVRYRQAIMARNCMHGFQVVEAAGGGKTGTQLALSYEAKIKAHWIRDWIFNHPRFVIPALAALVATISIAIFDPIRTFFIKAHVEHSFDLKRTKLYRWFKNQATDIFTFKHRSQEQKSLNAIWDDRKEAIDQIQTWLMETADTFIVVQGPRGSGKKELVLDQALKDRKNILFMDCKPIQDARGDSSTIYEMASQVGYRPVFSWMNSISSLIDLAAQGTIGVKSGFSETLDTQLAKIMQNTSTALKIIGLSGRKKDDKDAQLSEDDYLEAHPERRPVVVIDNFLHKNEESTIVYDKIAEWAAQLTTGNIAHVIFLTNDASYSKSLAKALPDRVFRQLALGDISREVALKFVTTHLDIEASSLAGNEKPLSSSTKHKDLQELEQCIDVIGGRLTDLEFLARRLVTGQTPRKAIEEIVEQSASEVLKMFLIDTDRAGRKWSPNQAWFLIKRLAEDEALRYNEVLLSPTFASSLTAPSSASGESVLEALSQAELVTISSANGRPQAIKAGKPVYQAAFKMLCEDHVLKSRLDLAILTELTKIENKNIDKYEQELVALATLPKQPKEVLGRVNWLLQKLEKSQGLVEGWEREMGGLKKVLSLEY